MSVPARPTGGVHEAVLYSSPTDLAALLAPRIGTSVAAGEPVVAVLDGANRDALRTALGGGADDVEFQEPARVHDLPAFTVAIRWARLCRHAAAGRTTVVAQHVDDLPGVGPEHWARLDIAVDVAIADLPLTVLCPYAVSGEQLGRVRATHSRVLTEAGSRPSDTYRSPHDAVVEYPPPPPPDLGAPEAELGFTVDGLVRVRRLVAQVAVRGGLADGRVSDLVLATNEIASNSVEHGPGSGLLRIWTAAQGLVVEVTDRGSMNVPFPGLTAPSAQGERGRGLWLASELSDVLQVWSDATGTIVRLHAER